jgi:hypothetical protein
MKISPDDRFGRWTVLGWDTRKREYRCRCICGKRRLVSGSALKSGESESCGCLRKDRVRYANLVRAGKNPQWALDDVAVGICASGMLKYEGVERSLLEWAAEYGIEYNTLYKRLQRGWTTTKALTTPTKTWCRSHEDRARPEDWKYYRTFAHDGRRQSWKQWAEEFDVPPSYIYEAVKFMGLSLEEAVSRAKTNVSNK